MTGMSTTPTAPVRADACSSCRYWTAPANGSLGACRRFPLTERKEAGDWCGEHKSVAVAEAATPAPAEKKSRGQRRGG
jgi:hypothetical protein